MKLRPNLVHEFEEICAEYSAHDEQGRDIIALVKMFGDENDDIEMGHESLAVHWRIFLGEHSHQVTVAMVGQILYLLITYWVWGQIMFEVLPELEKILVRDTVQEISDEIKRRSEENGDLSVGG